MRSTRDSVTESGSFTVTFRVYVKQRLVPGTGLVVVLAGLGYGYAVFRAPSSSET